jgi:hypothetical protein
MGLGRGWRWIAGAGLLLSVVGVGPASAEENGQHDPILGDMNVDGVPDRVTLTAGPAPDLSEPCSVRLELGDGAGGFGSPSFYGLDVPGMELDNEVGYCPDMGVIVDLGGEGVNELVLAFFVGGPLVVLRDFEPVATYSGSALRVDDPSIIGFGPDFNGDGLIDLYLWSDQSAAFETMLNTPQGALIRGPLDLPGDPLDYEFADFDADGATDLVAFYLFSYKEPDGVAVVLDDGTHIQLIEDDSYFWAVQVADADGDGNLDVTATGGQDGQERVFLGDGAGGFSVATCFGQVATLVGSTDDDVLTGTEAGDVIIGFGGHDEVSGLGGNDIICSDSGYDVVDGGSGNDVLLGGNDGDIIIGGNDDDYIDAGGGADYVSAGSGADYVQGDAGADLVFGGIGDDEIAGGLDGDRLNGGAGADRLRGGRGNDTVVGGSGSDAINGGGQTDVCTGGTGINTLISCETSS